MTHPPEVVEAVARALLREFNDTVRYEELHPDVKANFDTRATALLDKIAPLYREQAARKVYGHAGAIRKQEAEAATWGGPDPRGDHYRTNAIAYAVALENIAAAIRNGE